MRTKLCMTVLTGLMCVFMMHAAAQAEVDWEILKSMELNGTPIDIAVAPNGSRIFVLTSDGQLQIYNVEGKLMGQMPVGPEVDRINTMQRDDIVFLSSTKEKSVQIVMVDFIRQINVTGSPYMGAAQAPVIVAVFSDFEWAFCSRLVPMLDQVIEKYPQQVKVVFKNYPIRSHKNAQMAAEAALAAGAQGKFWEMHDLLFDHYNKLSGQKINELARQLELDLEQLQKDMNGSQVKNQIQQDIRDAKRANVTGTPTVFINGRRLKRRSVEGFSNIIEEELAKLKAAQGQGQEPEKTP